METLTEENYLKCIYKLSEGDQALVKTSAIAKKMKTKSASVTDMIKRLSGKNLLHYEAYKGVRLTEKGRKKAVEVIRKHRLWEVFLVNVLKYEWDEVHQIAEQLEHVNSEDLFKRLEKYLGYPKFDPHGDPIPDAKGRFSRSDFVPISEMNIKDKGIIMGVVDSSKQFLQYLGKTKLKLGNKVRLVEKHEYDNSLDIKVNNKSIVHISQKIARNILISLD
jgi:DtxR family Mn-dependent transcriptional regulator